MSEIEQLRAEVERMRLVFDAARVYRLSAKPGSGWDRDEARVILFAAVDKDSADKLASDGPATGGVLTRPIPVGQFGCVLHALPPEHSPVEMCRCGKRWPCPGAPTQTGTAPQDVPPSAGDQPELERSMAKFDVGDRVQMPGVPMVVEVLELGACPDGTDCELGAETFRFADPGGQGDDWAHSSEFEKVPA